jgi:formate dehydrogenase subunit gamma
VGDASAQWGVAPDARLPVLHAVQEAAGYVPADAVPMIAAALNLSRAEVHGVLTYYPHFRERPPGRHLVQLCRAESCQACGGDALAARAEQLLGCAMHDTRADGAVTLEPVYCLGLCACSPAAMIDGQLHGRLSPETFEQIAAAAGVLAWARRSASPRRAKPLPEGSSGCSCRAIRRRSPSAPMRWPPRCRPNARVAANRSNWCATVRADCSGSNRWSKSKRRKVAWHTAR